MIEPNISSGASSMGNNAFAAMLTSLVQQPSDKPYHVSADQYQTWRQGYVFDALQNLRYGQSFCNAFDIADNVLFHERDADWADMYIQQHYVK